MPPADQVDKRSPTGVVIEGTAEVMDACASSAEAGVETAEARGTSGDLTELGNLVSPDTEAAGALLDGALLADACERPFDFAEAEPAPVPDPRALDPTDPPDPVESANATAGNKPPTTPTPSNTASTPTRPT